MNMNPAIVICTGVSKTYLQGRMEVLALQDINVAVKTGGFVALAGPSGSGKTTLLNLIGSLDRPDQGSIVVNGRDYSRLSSSEMAELRLQTIGFVFQSYNLIPVLSAIENVEYVMLLQSVPARQRRYRAMEVLEEVGLQGLENRRPAELSGGQQQRVAVARAIASNPSIVLADEPTANLDSSTGEGLLSLMKDMNQKSGMTFIFSTHDRMVMDFAQRIITIRDGRIIDDQDKSTVNVS